MQLCADCLYDTKSTNTAGMKKHVFVELMNIATTSVKFSFHYVIYKQRNDDWASSSQYIWWILRRKTVNGDNQPIIYFRYMDDSFAIFKKEINCVMFLNQLNSLHLSPTFTYEKKVEGKLPLLDVLVEKNHTEFLTAVYRKPIFTEQYVCWDSFRHKSRKTDINGTLVHRAIIIYSPSKLCHELNSIHSILSSNGYPHGIADSGIQKNLRQFELLPKEGPQKCPVYLKLSWIGNISPQIR